MTELSQKLENFITRDDVLDALDNNDFAYVYSEYAAVSNMLDIRELTTLLLLSGFDPLHYMSRVPDFFLYGKLQSDISTLIKEFYVPGSIKEIGYCSFKHCKHMEKIHLPKTLERIHEEGLYSIDLKEIYYDGTLEEWKKIRRDHKWCNHSKLDKLICSDIEIHNTFNEDGIN